MISRRSFLKGGATAAIGAGAAMSLGGCSPKAEGGAPSAAGASGDGMNAARWNEKWSFEIPPEAITDDQIVDTVEADVVVVGAGTSGLVVANTAAEAGLDVVVVSASEKPVARGGSNGVVYCKVFERDGLDRIDPSMIEKEIYCAANKVDQKKWYTYYAHSEESANWAIDLMEQAGYKVISEENTPMDPKSLYFQPRSAIGWAAPESMELEPEYQNLGTGMAQPLFVKRLAEYLVEQGGRIDFKNIGRQLVRGDVPNGTEGRVTGIITEREDGTFAKYVGTKAVVLATGDFSANRDMMYKYAPNVAHYIEDDVYDGETDYDIGFSKGGLYKGDGQRMGLWVGAAWQKAPNCLMGSYTRVPGPTIYYGNHWGLLVDRNGERFMNEYCSRNLASETIYLQDGSTAFAIWDTAYARHFRTSTGWMNDSANSDDEATIKQWDEFVENKAYVKGDTLEEVIDQLGLPPSTIDTIKRYNDLAAAGNDEDFHKPADVMYEIKEGPFYGAAPAGSNILTILGGLRTNIHMQVCDSDDNPIPGLYNVGTMVGDAFCGTYTFQVEGANYGMNCLTFGYLTGKYIAENE